LEEIFRNVIGHERTLDIYSENKSIMNEIIE